MVDLPLWKIWFHQQGWWHSQLNGKHIINNVLKPPTISAYGQIKHVGNHYKWPFSIAITCHYQRFFPKVFGASKVLMASSVRRARAALPKAAVPEVPATGVTSAAGAAGAAVLGFGTWKLGSWGLGRFYVVNLWTYKPYGSYGSYGVITWYSYNIQGLTYDLVNSGV